MLREIGYSADKFAEVLHSPDCCRVDQLSPGDGSAPEWQVGITTPEVDRPWEIVVMLDLCGGYRAMNWIQLQRTASVS
ncbi:hypothetical protein ASE02_17020 [Phenylobacterium sp. Root700]|nr:hypothetical protein ASE02_17020 [Phenylobacterium sp. Root700]